MIWCPLQILASLYKILDQITSHKCKSSYIIQHNPKAKELIVLPPCNTTNWNVYSVDQVSQVWKVIMLKLPGPQKLWFGNQWAKFCTFNCKNMLWGYQITGWLPNHWDSSLGLSGCCAFYAVCFLCPCMVLHDFKTSTFLFSEQKTGAAMAAP